MTLNTNEFSFFTEKTLLFLMIFDQKGNVCEVNKRCEVIFKLPKDEIKGQSIYNFLLDDEESVFRDTISLLYQNKEQISKTFGFATLASDAILYIKFDLIYSEERIYAFGIDVTREHEEHRLLKSLSSLTKNWSLALRFL